MVKGMHARRLSKAACQLCRVEDDDPDGARLSSMGHTWMPGCWKYEKLNFMVGMYMAPPAGITAATEENDD